MTRDEPRRKRQSVARSFAVAWAGVVHGLRVERNVQFHLAATVVVVGLGLWLGLSAVEWAVIALACGLVWTAELLNTAIEAVVDLVSPDHREQARVAKDVASGAVLAAAIAAVAVGVVILGPALWERVSGERSVESVRRGSPDPAVGATAGLPHIGETFGRRSVAVGRPQHNEGAIGTPRVPLIRKRRSGADQVG